jgi:hypothetical protein
MIKRGWLLLAATLVLTGCVKTPALSARSVTETQNSVVDGKTTLDELLQRYGQPENMSPTATGKVNVGWKRTWSDNPLHAANVSRLNVLVDKQVVTRHIFTRYPLTLNNNFLKDATKESLGAVIKPGVTTESSMISRFGQPISYTFSDEGEKIMLYLWQNITDDASRMIPIVGGFIGTQSGPVYTLLITLNDNGTVKEWDLIHAQGKRGAGIMNASAIKLTPQ